MDEQLLIHSLGEFSGITLPLLDAAGATKVCEIGAEHGGNSTVLGGWLADRGGVLTSVDPAPSPAFMAWAAANRNLVRHVPALSLPAIPTLEPQDAWFIDGDHNWYTVYEELHAIHRLHRAADVPLLVLMHDVGWPWARRDLYYAPDRIPAPFRHPHSWELGVTLGSAAAIRGGFRGCGAFAVATKEGGARNGVLTAVEDFVADSGDELLWANVPGVFGLGVLFDRSHPAAAAMSALLAPLHENPLLARLERNRLANYLKVIEWQDREEQAA
jgi:hypothetical protein